MGWSVIPKPGTRYGPCFDACAHRDCAATRTCAASACVHCGQPIGYAEPYYSVTEPREGLAHADCEMKAADHEI